MRFALGGSKKGLCGDCDVYGSQLDVKKSLLLDRAGQMEPSSFQNEPRTSKGFVPSVLSLSENTAQLTSNWFHSSECYQLCIKCDWRAWFSCHTFRAAIALCSAALSETRWVTFHFSNICFSFFFFFWHKCIPSANHCLARERKCSIFTGTDNKCQKDPLQ